MGIEFLNPLKIPEIVVLFLQLLLNDCLKLLLLILAIDLSDYSHHLDPLIEQDHCYNYVTDELIPEVLV